MFTTLLLIVMLIVLLVAVTNAKFIVNKRRRLLPAKSMYVMVALYCAVGLAAALYLKFGNLEPIEKLTTAEDDTLFEQSENVRELLYANKLDEIDETFIIERKSVEANEAELRFHTMYEDMLQGVIAYRNDPMSNEIIMTVIKLPAVLDGYVVTNYYNPVNLDVANGGLYVTAQKRTVHLIDMQGKLLMIEDGGDISNGYYSRNGTYDVHLSVPSHIRIINDDSRFTLLE